MATVNFKLGGVLEFVTEQPDPLPRVTVTYQRFTLTARGSVMFTLPDGQQVQVKISYVDAQGNPAEVDGDVAWSSSDENIATVTVDPSDSTLAVVAATVGGAIGQVQIIATADADLGAGTRELVTLMDVDVVAGEAVAGTISPVGGASPIP